MLHKYISGEREAETLSFVDDDFFENNNIQWIGGVNVSGIDTTAKTVSYDGSTVTYDRLLIATGSVSSIPPVGVLRTAENVYGLRHFSDAQAIREAAAGAEKIVIIGAGLVGLDAAYALIALDKDITMVDFAPRILAVNLDETAGLSYQKRFEEVGIKFILGVGVGGTTENDRGEVTEVSLADGQVLPCDMVIVATGVRPATDFLVDSGIAYERAITVDDMLATNVPDVYAAGDVAGLSGTWPNAMRQGEVAAKNMCGVETKYTDTFAIKNTINFFDLVTLSLGALEPEEGDTVFVRADRRVYQKYILRGDVVVGVILQGNISYSGFWQYLIKNAIPLGKFDKPVWKLSYSDFCALDEKGEYIWNIAG